MATRPRKKWQLRYRTTAAVDTFTSERKAYDFVQVLARSYVNDPDSMDPRLYVYVDEGAGRGWERYEDLNLADLATTKQRLLGRAGICPVCGRDFRLTRDGKVWNHGAKDGSWPPRTCDGAGRPPKGEVEDRG